MRQNPYSPPNSAPVMAKRKSSLLCKLMFWLSCVLCVGMLGIAANGCYQYWFYTSQKGITFPTRILAENVCVACSAIGMLYAAMNWRRQLTKAGAVSFIGSLLTFFVGPPLLHLLM